MVPDRIPLDTDEELHETPFITTEDHLRERQDKSFMPWPRSADREREREINREDATQDSQSSGRGSRRNRRSRRSRSSRRRSSRTTTRDEPNRVERKAVQKVVRQLKENGVSDEFIAENMDKIRERVRSELQ